MQAKDKKEFFQELIHENKGLLVKITKSYCQDDEDRKDLFQEMMIQIWLSLNKYNDHFKISTWIYRIAMNVAISFYRKKTN